MKFIFLHIIFLLVSLQLIAQRNETRSVSEDNYSTFVEFKWSNDFVFQTDQYFSNGMALQIYAPFMSYSPLNYFLLPVSENAKVLHGISLNQNIYTPADKSSTINRTDRPFASYLVLSNTRVALNDEVKEKITSEICIGTIGKYGFGQEVQNGIHSILPTSGHIRGWENQISPDLLLLYSVKYEKGFLSNNILNFDGFLFGTLGVPFTELGPGITLRLGKLNDYFNQLYLSQNGSTQYYVQISASGKYVIYNATLQGGLFNNNNIYTVGSINRVIGNLSLKGIFSINNFRLEAGIYFITPEFEYGKSHQWGSLGITLAF